MATVQQIKKKLNELGLQNVYLTINSMDKVTYRTGDNKMVKGIHCAEHGPMTVTSVYREKADAMMSKVSRELMSIGAKRQDNGTNVFLIEETTYTKKYVTLSEQWLPAYHHSANLDLGYKKIYIIPMFHTDKKD